MAQVLTIAMQKGGTGKTTTTVNVGAYLAERGARVLLVDLDPQGNLTKGSGILREQLQYSSYEVILNPNHNPRYAIKKTDAGVDAIPSTLALQGAERELLNEVGRELYLREALSHVRDQYDYILIDTQPFFGTITQNALAAATAVIVPVQVEIYPFEDLPQLDAQLALMRKVNPTLQVGGYVCTLYDSRTNLSRHIEAEMRKRYGELVFQTIIPKNTKLAEAPAMRQPINMYDPTSTGAKAYKQLTDEIEVKYGYK
jgi:chromosome partitioning protein